MEAAHQQAQAVEKLGLKVTEDAAAGSFLATGADQDIRGQCLPDTDDPRGPKGKWRGSGQGGPAMATASVEGNAVLEVRVTKPNGEKWHHASLYVPQFEATATFRAIIKKIKKDYQDINQ
jgi:hypothetical protein